MSSVIGPTQSSGGVSLIVEILRKPAGQRSTTEAQSLLNELRQVEFFVKYNASEEDEETLAKCCQFLSLETFTEGETVFDIDSLGRKFYVILEGDVSVNMQEDERHHQQLKLVKTLHKGDSFGEIGLIFRRPHLTTIACLTPCSFGVLTLKQFQLSVQLKEASIIMQDIEILHSMQLFDSWSPNKLRDLYINSVWLSFSKGQAVYDIGSRPDSIFVIQEGEFVVNNFPTGFVHKLPEFSQPTVVYPPEILTKQLNHHTSILNN